jgi:SAM-dependent methyltransferase
VATGLQFDDDGSRLVEAFNLTPGAVARRKEEEEMDRSTWLQEQRRVTEAQDDTIYAPIYDQKWGAIAPTHQQFFHRFLGLCPPQGLILDAACGTGKYWPLILASGRRVFGIDQSQGMLARAHAKLPEVPSEKVGLQELRYRETFAGAVCNGCAGDGGSRRLAPGPE